MLAPVSWRLKLFSKNPASAWYAIKRRLYNALTLLLPGNNVRCNICNWEGHRFFSVAGVSYIRYNAVCPKCGSVERNRALTKYLENRGSFGNRRLRCLEIGPFKGSRTYFESRNCDYISIDIDSELATEKMDVTHLGFPVDFFEMIICSHVLEHVDDDLQAMRELYRVLRNEGNCFIMVPFNRHRTDTIEYKEPNPLDPLHLRYYGMDIIDRLKSTGFNVSMLNLVAEISESDIKQYGLSVEEFCFVCVKNNLVQPDKRS